MMTKPDKQMEALKAYRDFPAKVVVAALMSKTHDKRDTILRLLRLTPQMSLESMATPELFMKFGFWPGGVRGWSDLQSMPRYFKGRKILIKTTVDPYIDSDTYMSYNPKGERFVTHNATLVARTDKNFIVDVEGASSLLEVPIEETLELNQPHVFAYDVKGDIIL